MTKTEKRDHPSRPTNEWKAVIKEYTKPRAGIAIWQLINSVGLYVLLWTSMYFMLNFIPKPYNWLATMPVAILCGALLVRVFIIFHDCGHDSFFKSKFLNNLCGHITGTMAFTPFVHWRWEHNTHHAGNGNLERRGVGDIWTMTVNEYLSASTGRRFVYRFIRNPFVLFVIGPMWTFMIAHRFPVPKAKKKEKISVLWSNLMIITMVVVLGLTFGWLTYLVLTATVMTVASTLGIWLFYVQHQFEDTYYETKENWDFYKAAIHGSSFYKLPKVRQWFSVNIGYHHIHHLSSKIPNYNLERCHNSHEMFNEVTHLTFWQSVKCVNFRLWDQDTMKLITFRQLREKLKRQQAIA